MADIPYAEEVVRQLVGQLLSVNTIQIHLFSSDAKCSKLSAKRLGYPITDIELQDSQFYACFEESISEYSSQVNQFQIRENLLNVKGAPTGSDMTNVEINSSCSFNYYSRKLWSRKWWKYNLV